MSKFILSCTTSALRGSGKDELLDRLRRRELPGEPGARDVS